MTGTGVGLAGLTGGLFASSPLGMLQAQRSRLRSRIYFEHEKCQQVCVVIDHDDGRFHTLAALNRTP